MLHKSSPPFSSKGWRGLFYFAELLAPATGISGLNGDRVYTVLPWNDVFFLFRPGFQRSSALIFAAVLRSRWDLL